MDDPGTLIFEYLREPSEHRPRIISRYRFEDDDQERCTVINRVDIDDLHRERCQLRTINAKHAHRYIHVY